MTTTTAEEMFQRSDSTEPAYRLLPNVEDLVSDEADDLVIALMARERLARSTGEGLSLEDSMRDLGVDPADFGLE